MEEGDLRLAALLLVAFHALLRTGELRQVQAKHFAQSSGNGPILLSLPFTKSGQRHQNIPESVVINDPVVIQYVKAVVPRLSPDDRLFPNTEHVFSKNV